MVSRHNAYDRSTPFGKPIETRSLLGTLINLAAAPSIVSISTSGSFRGNVQKEMRSSWDFQTQLAALNKGIWILPFSCVKNLPGAELSCQIGFKEEDESSWGKKEGGGKKGRKMWLPVVL